MTSSLVKICGISTSAMLGAARDAKADMVGFVFVDESPRHVSAQTARDLTPHLGAMASVGLFVNPSDDQLQNTLDLAELGYIQLHGAETPARMQQIKTLTGKKLIKAIGIGSADDIAKSDAYHGIADYLILDAKPPAGASRPGGLGASFDWTLLNKISGQTPWLLSGGLTPENVAAAVLAVHALPGYTGVDVSTGVERTSGNKDAALISSFVTNAQKPQG